MSIFNIIKTENFIIKNTNTGPYPLISSSGENNGVVKYIDQYTMEPTDGKEVITLARNGTVGACFRHTYKFGTTQDVVVLESKTPIENIDIIITVL